MSGEISLVEFMQELSNLRILTSLQKNALEELENKLVEQTIKNGELEAQMVALQEMRKPSLKDLLMQANNAGLFVTIELGVFMGIPSLKIDVEKWHDQTVYADGLPCTAPGIYKRTQTYTPLFQIPNYPDGLVDLLMQSELIRELMEAPK